MQSTKQLDGRTCGRTDRRQQKISCATQNNSNLKSRWCFKYRIGNQGDGKHQGTQLKLIKTMGQGKQN